ncbi:MAG TPA: helix-turn-helix transcriptional regulator [Allosphingosinicella sp.]|jgi:transcriptional regulator with XRE-family HTH domain|nr:helix-turn-helix transcriptional regulator [Allosphingosinicella sp.]
MAARPVDLVGTQIRTWRARRRLSQLDLALDAEISTRHLSFIETGRSKPSRTMLLRLAERLRIPPRERNVLLVAGGFAPGLPARSLDDPDLAAARQAVDKVLAAYEPFPALAVDLHWNLVAANAGIAPFLAGCAGHLLEPPLNVLRLSLHPEGLAPRIENLAQWRAYVFRRLEEQIDVSADPVLAALLEELRAYPGGTAEPAEPNSVAILLRIRQGENLLSFLSMTTVFGTPVDITLSELAIEAFLPADSETAAILRG